MSPAARRIVGVAAVAAVVAAAVCARVAIRGAADLELGLRCREAGLEQTAIDLLARAARAYLPAGGSHRPAREALLAIGRDAEAAGRAGDALKAYREARGAMRATRWLITPDADLLDAADRAIARLMAAQPAVVPLSEADHLALLRRDLSPDPWISLAAVLLFLAWVGALARGVWTGVTPEGAVSWRRVGWHAAAAVVLLALWLAAVRLA